MSKDLISIIVPVYQVEDMLEQCIQSILQQTYHNLEIILIDDGAFDSSPQICDRFTQLDSRIQVIHKKNQGVSAARNDGLAVATGSYIGFVDSDDWIEPTMFEELHTWMMESNADVSICGWWRHQDSSSRKGRTTEMDVILSPEEAIRYALRGNYYEGYLFNKLFKASLLKDLSTDQLIYTMRTDIHVCEDLLLCCQIFQNCSRILYRNIPLYHYRIRSTSALRSFTPKKLTEFVAREEIVVLTHKISKALHHVAMFTFTQATLSNCRESHLQGNHLLAKEFRKLSHRYIFPSLFGNGVGLKARLRLFAMYVAPVMSVNMWLALKEKFCFVWSLESDK